MTFKTAACGLVLLVSAGAVRADFVSYGASIPTASTPFSTTFSLQLFDGALGTLTGVTLSLTSNITGTIRVWNAGTASTPFTNAFAAIPVTVTSSTPDSTAVSATATAVQPSGVALGGVFGMFTEFPGLTATASNTTSVAPANFFNYIGTSTSTALFTAMSTVGSYGGTAPPTLFFGGAASADGLFTVQYEYAAVPVPAAAWLFGSGLLGLAALRRRRRA